MELTVHHVAITVRNMDESLAWYTHVFGAEVLARYEKRGMEIAHLKFDAVRLEFFSGDKTQPLPEYRTTLMGDLNVVGTKHVCFETNDIEGLKKELVGRGVEFATEIDTAGFGGKFAFIKDPNGILIELYQA